MDPLNRSHVWEMITRLKKNRVVILTTHSMEEAVSQFCLFVFVFDSNIILIHLFRNIWEMMLV